jgi:hypothetical protein
MREFVVWTIVGLTVWGSAISILQIGKPRKPMTPGIALAVLIINAGVVWGILYLR